MAFKKLTDLSSSLSPSGDSVLPISDGDKTYKVTLDTVRGGSLTDITQIKGRLDSIEAESGSIRTDFNDFKDSYLIVSQSFNDRISALENYHLPTATPNATLAPTSTPEPTPNPTSTPQPTFTLTNDGPVNEGQNITWTLTTSNVANGTVVPFALTGTASSPQDYYNNQPLLFYLQNNTATYTVASFADNLTELGAETVILTLAANDNAGNATGSISSTATINDTSQNPTPTPTSTPQPTPTSTEIQGYVSLIASETYTDEGTLVTWVLNSVNIPDNTTVGYSLSGTGITSDDLVNADQMTGSFLMDENLGDVSIAIKDDNTLEADEALTLTLVSFDSNGVATNELSDSVIINDQGVLPTPSPTVSTTNTPTPTPSESEPVPTATVTATVEPVNLTEADRILNVASYYTSNNSGGNVGSTFETNNQTNTYDQILQWMCDNDTHISSAMANQGTVERPHIYSVGGTRNIGDKIYRDIDGTLFTDEGFSLYSIPGPFTNASGNSWVSVDSNSNIVSVTPFSCV